MKKLLAAANLTLTFAAPISALADSSAMSCNSSAFLQYGDVFTSCNQLTHNQAIYGTADSYSVFVGGSITADGYTTSDSSNNYQKTFRVERHTANPHTHMARSGLISR